MPANSQMNRSMPNEQQQSFATKSYQFQGGVYDYVQQANRATNQANYSVAPGTLVQYQPTGRVQQSNTPQYMMECSNNMDVSMHNQVGPIDGWQMSNPNGNLPNNWTSQNCLPIYQQQQSMSAQHQQQLGNQQLAIESHIPKPQQLAQQQQMVNSQINNHLNSQIMIQRQAMQSNANYYGMPNAPYPVRYHPHHSNHLHLNTVHPTHQLTAFGPASLHPIHHHQQSPQTTLSPKNFLGRDTQFPPDCVESVKPNLEPPKRLTIKDLQPQDPSKLTMSLKCGQLAEFTQALNYLIVLSIDDPAFKEFRLTKNRPLQAQLICQFRDLLDRLFLRLFEEPATPDQNNNLPIMANDLKEDGSFNVNGNKALNEEQKRKLSQFVSDDNCLVVDQRAVKCANSGFVITSMFPEKEYDRKSFDECLSKGTRSFSEELHETEVKPEEVSPLYTISQHKEDSNQRCIALSTLIRNLSFQKSNEEALSKDEDLLFILGKIILYEHHHTEKRPRSSSDQFTNGGQTDVEPSKEAWWYEALNLIQGNALVTLSNMSAHLNFQDKDENIVLPILEGLLHWSTCPSSIALDAFEGSTSRKRLALECLVKLSVYESNVDLLLASPTLYAKSPAVFSDLVNQLGRNQPQIMREFALVLLCNFIKSDRNVASAISVSGNIVEQLIRYLEQYKEHLEHQRQQKETQDQSKEPKPKEQKDSQVNDQMNNATMAKKAAACLADLAKVPENNFHFNQKQDRLIQLLTSSLSDNSGLSKLLQDIVYEVPEGTSIRPAKMADSADVPMETGDHTVR